MRQHTTHSDQKKSLDSTSQPYHHGKCRTMSLNFAPEEPLADRKRKAISERTTSPTNFNVDQEALPAERKCRTAGKGHAASETPKASTNVRGGEKRPFLVRSQQSRLQWLQDHHIMPILMSFLDEVGLFQLENAHSKMIGHLSIARQWSYLSSREERENGHGNRRWRQINDTDTNIVLNEMKSTKSQGVESKDRGEKDGDSGIFVSDHPPRDDLLARIIGRNFAEEAIFVRQREKEASIIYDFDRIPDGHFDVVQFMNVGKIIGNIGTGPGSWRHHWHEWYDYRATSVIGKNAFVRLSLRDGSGRCWEGFRVLVGNSYNPTYFGMLFRMEDIIKEMRWKELDSFLKLKKTEDDERPVRASMEYLMRMTQLTVSIGGKLLVATGGSRRGCLDSLERCQFHARHYRLPLSDTSQNELGWTPYTIRMEFDSARNELAIQFECDHPELPFMKAGDIGKPNAYAHW